MAIWAINLAGGIGPILQYVPKGIEGNELLVFLGCVSALLATWAAPAVSVSDFTREAISQKAQTVGQIAGILLSYLLFAFASIAVIVGSEIAFGTPIWNVLDVVEKFDSKFAIAVSVLTICLTTLSVNITGNIVPAGYQLASLFPKKLTFKTGAFIAAVSRNNYHAMEAHGRLNKYFHFLRNHWWFIKPSTWYYAISLFCCCKKAH